MQSGGLNDALKTISLDAAQKRRTGKKEKKETKKTRINEKNTQAEDRSVKQQLKGTVRHS